MRVKRAMTKTQVRRARQTLNMTQEELGKALGVTATSVARWEMGLHQISEPTARLLRLLVEAREARRPRPAKRRTK